MDRIEINGIWYIKEDNVAKNHTEIKPVHSEQYVVENGDFCFEASRIFKEDGSFYDDCAIECTDKRFENRKDWKIDYWDNNDWMRNVLNNYPISLKELSDLESKENMDLFLAFLQFLKDKNWL